MAAPTASRSGRALRACWCGIPKTVRALWCGSLPRPGTVRRAGQDGKPRQVAVPGVRYADGLDGAGLAAEAEAGADEAAADDAGADDAGGAELADVEADTDAVAVGVAVAVAVGVVGVGVGVGVGVLDLVVVGVGVGVTTAGRTDEGVWRGGWGWGMLRGCAAHSNIRRAFWTSGPRAGVCGGGVVV
jgi:hypothetical protein